MATHDFLPSETGFRCKHCRMFSMTPMARGECPGPGKVHPRRLIQSPDVIADSLAQALAGLVGAPD